MRKQQSGFTLIELIVVIVILGILAATAIPRFVNLTDQARQAVAEGIIGGILSSSVIQFGEAQGQANTLADIIANVGISSNESIFYRGSTTATFTSDPAAVSCAATNDPDSIAVRVGSNTGTTEATGLIPGGLCAG